MAEFYEIEEFLFAQDKYSEATQNQYRYLLRLWMSSVEDIEHFEATKFQKWLKGHGWGDNTQYVAACAIRAFIKWRWGAKHPALLYSAKRKDTPPQRTLTALEVDKLYKSFPVSDFGRRDTAMLSVFIDTGLRASEICRLSLDYLHLDEHYLSVVVKGGKWMDKSFSVYTALDLDNWLSVRDYHALDGVETVFVGIDGKTPGEPMTRDGLRVVVRKWGERAGLEKPISPHAFRRTTTTLGAENGASDQLLMQQMGWKSAEMVRRYTKMLRNRAFADNYSPVAKVRNG